MSHCPAPPTRRSAATILIGQHDSPFVRRAGIVLQLYRLPFEHLPCSGFSRGALSGDWWFGGRTGHANIALACVLRFVAEAHPGLVALADYPALRAHAARCEALPVFQKVSQSFIPPA